MKKRFLNILFWSVLSAAFIGPGTITTAASAGSGYGYSLLWALAFSTLACLVLQEASARLTISSGRNLGQAIRRRFSQSLTGQSVAWVVLFSIVIGCAAYEAGNILGAVAGATLVFDVSTVTMTLLIGITAFLLLWFGSTKMIAHFLGIVVAVMGICFLSTALIMQPSWGEILSSLVVPSLPGGSEILVIGLIGTTVVPYNLFLGSGLKHTQGIKEMRFGLASAIILGGIVSMGVLVVGTSIAGELTYARLAGSLGERLGGWAFTFFGIGLCAAGLSSALTAPLAAAITARGILAGQEEVADRWRDRGRNMRIVWGGVLLTGIIFGVLQVQPIPAIILAQALNGIILPFVAVFLLLVMNDSSLLDADSINSHFYNALMGIIVFATFIIGLTNFAKAVTNAAGYPLINEEIIFYVSAAIALTICWPVIQKIIHYRQGGNQDASNG